MDKFKDQKLLLFAKIMKIKLLAMEVLTFKYWVLGELVTLDSINLLLLKKVSQG